MQFNSKNYVTGAVVFVKPEEKYGFVRYEGRSYYFKFVFQVRPVLLDGDLELEDVVDAPPPQKEDEIMFLLSEAQQPECRHRNPRIFEWLYKRDFDAVTQEYAALPEYRVMLIQTVIGQPVADPVNRRWVTPKHRHEYPGLPTRSWKTVKREYQRRTLGPDQEWFIQVKQPGGEWTKLQVSRNQLHLEKA